MRIVNPCVKQRNIDTLDSERGFKKAVIFVKDAFIKMQFSEKLP